MGERRVKRLQVNRETVRELNDADMGSAAGGQPRTIYGCWTPIIHTVPVQNCLPPVVISGAIC